MNKSSDKPRRITWAWMVFPVRGEGEAALMREGKVWLLGGMGCVSM